MFQWGRGREESTFGVSLAALSSTGVKMLNCKQDSRGSLAGNISKAWDAQQETQGGRKGERSPAQPKHLGVTDLIFHQKLTGELHISRLAAPNT